MSEYEPGTVAVATVSGVPNVRVFRSGSGWQGPLCWLSDERVTDVRPLAVLDLGGAPYDRATTIETLRASSSDSAAWLADQIEAQTRPPKPPEPQGLGAVVEDAEGVTWVRVNVKTGTAEWRSTPPVPEHRRYRAIAAVRVLSEGVSDA